MDCDLVTYNVAEIDIERCAKVEAARRMIASARVVRPKATIRSRQEVSSFSRNGRRSGMISEGDADIRVSNARGNAMLERFSHHTRILELRRKVSCSSCPTGVP